MNLELSGFIVASLILGVPLATLSAQQARTSLAGSRAASFPIEETTIAELQAAYLDSKTTAREITQAYINRILAYDKRGPYLNSIITLNDRALADADKLDAVLKATGK